MVKFNFEQRSTSIQKNLYINTKIKRKRLPRRKKNVNMSNNKRIVRAHVHTPA